jgi:hypothetical protein
MTNPTISNGQPDACGHSPAIANRRLWFQVAGSGVAWIGLGLADMFISWLACVHEEQYGGPSFHPAAHVLFLVVSVLLFGLALLTGVLSYRSWRMLAGTGPLIQAEATDRKEFMSLAGFFISLTLGFGILWLSVPLFIFQMCARAR